MAAEEIVVPLFPKPHLMTVVNNSKVDLTPSTRKQTY
jgi:hypothetical protein